MSDQAQEQSPEARMMALLGAEEPESEEEQQAAPEQEGADAPEVETLTSEDQEEEQQEDDEEPPRMLKIKHDGQDIEKPETEVIELAQKGFDYTQKTQQLAEERKSIEEFTQNLRQQEELVRQQFHTQAALIEEIAKVTAIDQQLAAYNGLDWQALSNADPVEAQKLFFAYNQLQTQRGQAVNEVQQKQQVLTHAQQEALAAKTLEGKKVLERDIPGWNADKVKAVVETARQYGFNDSEISTLVDPRQVKVLHDAMQWRKLQASKPVTDKKVSNATPQLKAGAKDAKNAGNAQMKQARDALRKTGKGDYAAMLIERML
jgi:hypothetical protein